MAIIRALGALAPQLGPDVYLAETSVVIGDVTLGAGVSVWYGAVLRGDVGSIRVGARTNLQDNVTVHMSLGSSDAILGEDCIVGHNVVIHGAIIGNRVLVGIGSVVMDNARVGDGAWIAAGSVVPAKTEIPPGGLFLGGRVIRQVRESEHAWALGNIERYLELARQHRAAELTAAALPATAAGPQPPPTK
jgi:gamma-carbonic anhydrase